MIGPNCAEVIAELSPKITDMGPGLLDALSLLFNMPKYGGIICYYMNRRYNYLPKEKQNSDIRSVFRLALFTFSEFNPPKVEEPLEWSWVRSFTIAEKLYHQLSNGDQISVEGDDKDVFIRRKKEKSRPHMIKIADDKNELISYAK